VTEETEEAERNEFLDAFAANLGVTDQAAVDSAIQATIEQLIDEAVAAGELTEAEANLIRERIANGEYRIGFGIHGFGRGGFDGDFDGRGGRGHQDRDRDGDKDDADDATTPAVEATPATDTSVVA
jgi:hypothetical protein